MNDRESNAHGYSPLYIAVLNGDLAAATSIAKDGPDLLDGRNSHGHTALHYAALHGVDAGIARMMVEKGADVNAKDRAGHSPLFYAMHRRDEDMEAAVGAGLVGEDRCGLAVLPSTNPRRISL